MLLGVIFASIASGFGEITFLSLTASYHKSTVAGWSSGTGAAGVAGALVYAGLRVFLSPKVTLLIQIYIPVAMLLVYFILLGPRKPPTHTQSPPTSVQEAESQKEVGVVTPEVGGALQNGRLSPLDYSHETDSDPLIPPTNRPKIWRWKKVQIDSSKVRFFNKDAAKDWVSHVKYIPHLFQYMLPLFVVYFAEYAINQGFFELLYSPDTHLGSYCLDQFTQYRWLQVVYQIGVFISRTSVSVIYVRHFWVFAVLQVS